MSAETPTPRPWGCYERLLPHAIEAIKAQTPAAYLPWGALEYHGHHAAIGLDGLKAHHLCKALAADVGGLVLPPVYVAANTIKTAPDLDHPRHSLDFPEEQVRQLARTHFDQLADEAFAVAFVLCGHVGQPHYDILKEEATLANQRHADTHFWATSETDLLPDETIVVNHAALGEIALLMAAAEECVELDRLPADRVPDLEQDAVWGPDPRSASVELGQKLVAAFVAAAAPILRQHLTPSA